MAPLHHVSVLRVTGGLVGYTRAWELQRRLAAVLGAAGRAGDAPPHTLLMLEHKPVYTVGIRSRNDSDSEETRLRSVGADFVRSNRGGLITFHGPGQLIAYPILHLPHLKRTIKWYVCALERSVIRCCRTLGVETHTSPHTGVWVDDQAKICAVGIQGRRVTTHGIGLNCSTDLSWFDHIVPCGIPDKTVTSLSEQLQRHVAVDEVVPHFLTAFSEVFECDLSENSCNLTQLEEQCRKMEALVSP